MLPPGHPHTTMGTTADAALGAGVGPEKQPKVSWDLRQGRYSSHTGDVRARCSYGDGCGGRGWHHITAGEQQPEMFWCRRPPRLEKKAGRRRVEPSQGEALPVKLLTCRVMMSCLEKGSSVNRSLKFLALMLSCSTAYSRTEKSLFPLGLGTDI